MTTEVIDYFESGRKDHWLEQIQKSDWRAGAFLHRLLAAGGFKDAYGKSSRVLLLTEGDELISFCTYAEKDSIRPTELTPWVGFVYTFPQYRGRRMIGKLFEKAVELARGEGRTDVYLSTSHVGLYEKYGFVFDRVLNDIDGEPSRVYVLHAAP